MRVKILYRSLVDFKLFTVLIFVCDETKLYEKYTKDYYRNGCLDKACSMCSLQRALCIVHVCEWYITNTHTTYMLPTSREIKY